MISNFDQYFFVSSMFWFVVHVALRFMKHWSIYIWVYGWIFECVDEYLSVWINIWVYGSIFECMDQYFSVWINIWVYGSILFCWLLILNLIGDKVRQILNNTTRAFMYLYPYLLINQLLTSQHQYSNYGVFLKHCEIYKIHVHLSHFISNLSEILQIFTIS